jgi:prepilin-type N-terminal cleavage/methylation domain-containing protein
LGLERGSVGEQGFTLMELLIVIVVLGVLAGTVVFALTGVTSSAAVAACHADASSVENAVSDYNVQNTPGTATAALLTNNPPVAGAVTYLHSMPASNPNYAITIANGTVMIAVPSNATPVAYGTGDPCSSAGAGGGATPDAAPAVSTTSTSAAAAPTTTTTVAPTTTTTTVASNGVAGVPTSSNQPYFGQDTLTINNTKAITSMSVTISVALTTGLSYNGEYVTFPGGAGNTGFSSGAGKMTYTYVMNSGQTITPGYNGVVAAQFNGTGTARMTSGDTWTVTSTTSSGTTTTSGTF